MMNSAKNRLMSASVAAIAQACVSSGVSAGEGADQAVQLKSTPALQVSTSDGAYSMRVAGFLQFDHVHASGHGDGWNESTVRRARLGVRGQADTNWKYDFMFESGSGQTELFDANITYTGFDFGDIRIGQFKEPVGLEWSTGAPWWTFSDRGLVASLTPKRSIGVAVSKNGKNWGIHVGHFGSESTIRKSPAEDGATTGRFYFLPYKSDNGLVHLGVSAVRRTPAAGSVRIKAKHETAGQPSPSMDSGVISDVSSVSVLGGEALFQAGPFSLQGEYYQQDISRDVERDVSLSAAYVQISFLLTGEHRPYKLKKGGFGSLKPAGSKSAVELAARYDTLDLTDQSIESGSMDRLTVGLNWYVNRNIRLTTNYVFSKTDANARLPGADIHSIGIRSQFTF